MASIGTCIMFMLANITANNVRIQEGQALCSKVLRVSNGGCREGSEPTLGSCVGQDLQTMLGREQAVGGAVSGNGRVDVLPFLWPSRN